MLLAKQILDVLSNIGRNHSVSIMTGDNPRCRVREDPVGSSNSSHDRRPIASATAVSSQNIVPLSEILYRLTEEAEDELARTTMTILEQYQHEMMKFEFLLSDDIDKPLRDALLKNLVFFLESKMTKCLDMNK
ncbi:unnamed protein product [Clavelina lepadiformis]|uniref:Uncharacterized protein n=1 Tax=Clavelina lepadiformis TaxID=159417 RepID=A0ABP0FGQ4_CLALP